MIEMLRRQVAEEPDRTAYIFLDDRDGVTEITVGELDRRARCIAGRLQLELSPGDRALLVYPSGLEFICRILRLHVCRRDRSSGDVSEAKASDAAVAAHRARLRCPRRPLHRSNADHA